MDLPLVIPELDHDALRDNFSFRLSNNQGRRLFPSSHRILAMCFSIPSKEACLSTSSVTQHPHLSACIITLLATSCNQNTFICQFFLELESLVSLFCFSMQLFLYPPRLPFLPSSARLCAVQIPSLWSGL